MRLVVATRNAGKVRELHRLLAAVPGLDIVGLAELGIPESPEEDALEVFDTFEENALAKARYFARMTGEAALADDSGICVDALNGAPGVRSRRFAPVDDVRGELQDDANNRHLLHLLADVDDPRRTARYVCAAAVAWPDGREMVRTGACEGVVLRAARGEGGFGYDPLFHLPEEGMTFGELPASRKDEISHRGIAVRAIAAALDGRT
ncbi:RdgB/HAM1 family non-canonical purine NTP pyrophosphatase [Longimicrobium terrae]|uniref:dITP/XTP pyrophosphatase n=1 Tax=Longimicrobium terrae TaxID=1639882 RepID=A0A841GZY3_9BACT|nr:RdgB/HAM1 family non-canonical purine NTP pyrophosphatase [Longimicrobium terrae]MBB4637069.1 XTP/dITP diphosphohydrolase [Longimicrobium terrae]MBB6071323.1 XTP/dITP diphosphohydrolase [Longimicrobium terrae]NNC31458.1 RdgB/HAM1 family non-canonical purine NTP pyrophosphatase [Longimicrobium terrae]